MIVSLDDVASIGVVTDLPHTSLPAPAWTYGQNVRFFDGRIQSASGYSSFTTPTVTPYYLTPYADQSNFYWIYAGVSKIYRFDGTAHTNVTRQTASVDVDYTGNAADRWNGGILGGTPILNNGVDNPQYFDGTRFADMQWSSGDTWSTANKTAKVVREFDNMLIAMNVTEGGTNYPHVVVNSHRAEPGTMPYFDYSDATLDANRFQLGHGGHIVDGLALQGTFIVYKEGSAFRLTPTYDSAVFDIDPINYVPGMLAQGCGVEISGTHIVLARDGELYRFDGQTKVNLTTKRVQNYLKQRIDADSYQSAFLHHNRRFSEVWACYPVEGSTLPNEALVWNYQDNTFSIREIPASAHIAEGVVSIIPVETWDGGDSGSIDTWDGMMGGGRQYSPVNLTPVAASSTLYKLEDGNLANGSNQLCVAEKTGVALGGPYEYHMIKTVIPKMESTGAVNLYIGSSGLPFDGVAWSGPYSFDPSVDRKIDCRVTGNYHALRIESQADVSWKLSGFDVEYDFAGRQ